MKIESSLYEYMKPLAESYSNRYCKVPELFPINLWMLFIVFSGNVSLVVSNPNCLTRYRGLESH